MTHHSDPTDELIADLRRENTELRKDLNYSLSTTMIQNLQHQLAEKDAEIETLKRRVHEVFDESDALRRHQVANLEATVAEKSAEIERLNKEIRDMCDEIAALNSKSNNWRDNLHSFAQDYELQLALCNEYIQADELLVKDTIALEQLSQGYENAGCQQYRGHVRKDLEILEAARAKLRAAGVIQ